jgi:hypothetical protein
LSTGTELPDEPKDPEYFPEESEDADEIRDDLDWARELADE